MNSVTKIALSRGKTRACTRQKWHTERFDTIRFIQSTMDAELKSRSASKTFFKG